MARARARGVLWETYRKHYGAGGAPNVLIAKGTTRDFNPTIPQTEIDRELERDRARNTAELLAEFRSDLWAAKRDEVETQCDELVRKLRERYPVLVAELIRPRARRAVGDLP